MKELNSANCFLLPGSAKRDGISFDVRGPELIADLEWAISIINNQTELLFVVNGFICEEERSKAIDLIAKNIKSAISTVADRDQARKTEIEIGLMDRELNFWPFPKDKFPKKDTSNDPT